MLQDFNILGSQLNVGGCPGPRAHASVFNMPKEVDEPI